MQEAGLTHLIAYGNYADPGHITYLSGFFTRHGDSFVVIPLDDDPTLLTNWVMHDEPMHSEIWTTWIDDVRPCPPFTYEVVDELVDVIGEGVNPERIGLAGTRVVPVPVMRALESGVGDGLATADAVMAAARRVKSPLEVATIRRAAELAGVSIRTTMATCMPGVTERTAAAAGHSAMFAAGADYLAFIDTGAVVNGYYSDVSRSVAIGEPTAEGQRLLQSSEVLFAELVKLAKPGRSIQDLHQDAIRIAGELGYQDEYMPGGFGHGIGCMLFESPSLRYQTSTDVLEPGMTFAFEPMIIVDGLGTGCVEDVMLVTDSGIEPLSGLPTALYS
jgi:Xaa-Pro aminopeptidase